IQRLLEKMGHTVTLAGDGKAAVETWQQQPFDLILMDIQMPGMDGFQATRLIREREKATGEHIPIIALTAHATKGYQERCLAAGMDGYVSKPVRRKELLSVMARLMKPTPDKESPSP
ncbi:MAG: response regulator, partial [Calditrichaeota bacterium]